MTPIDPTKLELTPARKKTIDKAVKRTVEQYGETLKMLGSADPTKATKYDGNFIKAHITPSGSVTIETIPAELYARRPRTADRHLNNIIAEIYEVKKMLGVTPL